VTVGQISEKNVAIRTESILNPVLKFQVDLACFYGEEALARKKVEKWKKEKREEEKKQNIRSNNIASASLHNADAKKCCRHSCRPN